MTFLAWAFVLGFEVVVWANFFCECICVRRAGSVPCSYDNFDLTCIFDIHRVNIFFDRYHNRPLMHTSLFLFSAFAV